MLISDGNSQDRWEELLAAADRLRATDANVYAVTASHDYYFRYNLRAPAPLKSDLDILIVVCGRQNPVIA